MSETNGERITYVEVRAEAPAEQAELVCDYVVEHLTNGMVLEEEEDSPVTGVVFYLPKHEHPDLSGLGAFLSGLPQVDGAPQARLKTREIVNLAWMERYRASIQPLRIGEDIVVRPTWVEPIGATYEIVIEPKMAFGTGSHATTRSSLLAIRNHFRSGMTFLDMGCGSGILSILADKMGASRITAIDYDSDAVENTRENFPLNGVKAPCDIRAGSIEQCENDEPYDFVAANIIRSTILDMLPRLLALTKPGGFLVLSGLLDSDEEAISTALKAQGEVEFTIIRDQEWLTYTVPRKTVQ